MPATLFGDSTPPSTRCPQELTDHELLQVKVWAEQHAPWITREALESLTPLEDHIDACLNYFQGKKSMRPNWVGTIKNWIRRDERPRLARMANNGNTNARLALLRPCQWRDKFDRIDRQLANTTPSEGLIIPRSPDNSGTSVSLTRRDQS